MQDCSCTLPQQLEPALLHPRYLCESTGRCKPAEVGQSRGGAAATAQGGAVSWQQRFFENTFALHFDGERDFVRLPPTLLSKGISGHGFALDILFLAHLIEPAGQGAPAGGGVLLGMQAGRSSTQQCCGRCLQCASELCLHMSEAACLQCPHCCPDSQRLMDAYDRTENLGGPGELLVCGRCPSCFWAGTAVYAPTHLTSSC